MTGGVLLSHRWLFTPQGYFIGAVIDFIFAGFLGLLGIYTVWLLRERGRLLFVKALSFSIFIWLFLVHQLWGVVFAFLVARYGRAVIVGDRPPEH